MPPKLAFDTLSVFNVLEPYADFDEVDVPLDFDEVDVPPEWVSDGWWGFFRTLLLTTFIFSWLFFLLTALVGMHELETLSLEPEILSLFDRVLDRFKGSAFTIFASLEEDRVMVVPWSRAASTKSWFLCQEWGRDGIMNSSHYHVILTHTASLTHDTIWNLAQSNPVRITHTGTPLSFHSATQTRGTKEGYCQRCHTYLYTEHTACASLMHTETQKSQGIHPHPHRQG